MISNRQQVALASLGVFCITASGSTVAAFSRTQENPASQAAESATPQAAEQKPIEQAAPRRPEWEDEADRTESDAGQSKKQEPGPGKSETAEPAEPADIWKVDRAYAEKIFNKIDELVQKQFYDAAASKQKWPPIAAEHKESILKASNIAELSSAINAALTKMNTSHTQYVTANDETFFFLKALFAPAQKRPPSKKELAADFAGFITGGVDYQSNEVRYVLDGTPAFLAGMLRGDRVVSVDGQPYRGLSSLRGLAGKAAVFSVKRGDQVLTLTMKINNENVYDAYARAIEKSARIENTPAGPIGYFHYWCGGQGAREAMEEVMMQKLSGTKGLILDLRDGYGANSLEDLDIFYRTKSAYPAFIAKDRNGRVQVTKLYYDKPIVALINGGSRSGKELIAFSLKRAHRAVLIGGKTAGAVVGGRLFPIDDRSALFLAVIGGTVDGEILEGKGVLPDIEVSQSHDGSKDAQLERARAELGKLLSSSARRADVRPAARARN